MGQLLFSFVIAPAAAPQAHPHVRTLGDAVLLAQGAYDPLDRFVCQEEGLRIRARGQLIDGVAWPVPIVLLVTAEEARAAGQAGAIVLVDAEGAPVARVAVDSLWLAAEGLTGVSGRVSGLPHAAHAFAGLARPAREVRDDPRSDQRRGVLLNRPLLAPEVSALAEVGEDSPVLLLVRAIDPLVPADVLVKATIAAAQQIPRAEVVTVPFGRRDDPADDGALGPIVLRNYGAAPVDVLLGDAAWERVRRALDEDDEAVLRESLDPGSLEVLRRWRPPRSQRGLVVFFTGLSGSGKSTIARGLVDRLHETSRTVTVLDGDVARRMLSSGLGFSRSDRDLNIRRLGWVGAEVARHGGLAVLAPIAPFAATRAEVRRMVEAHGDLVLVWVATPLEECERRDRKGLYARARRGEIPDFTGISSPYEEPDDADIVLDTTSMSVAEAVDVVWDHLVDGGWLAPDRGDLALSE
jgi:sulfate adenylyltransferase